MAIYHLEAKVITRSVGRSAVAASAYMSCSAIYNDYDGIQHDYTRKQGLVYEQIFLPTNAPPEWNDRSILWNAVEETEKTKDSRLAREFVVALPTELNRDEWIELLNEYVKDNFVNDGMCADVCIHDTDGHNPHAHIMLTVRPLDENGKWQNKTQKEYLCVKNGEEKGLTADEFKITKSDGWEKQYPYMVGKKKEYMPPSVAEVQGYIRADKHPKSTRYGRQNPISERWNSDEQLLIWRKNWADVNNKYLERSNVAERIDYRSNAERGIDEQPTIHEGVTARIMEQRGFVSDRCEINRQIKADNKLLGELKAQVKKLLEAVKNTIPYIAETLETMRENIMIAMFQFKYSKKKANRHIEKPMDLDELSAKIHGIDEKLKAISKELQAAVKEKNTLSPINIFKHRELNKAIAELTENINSLSKQKSELSDTLEYQQKVAEKYEKATKIKKKYKADETVFADKYNIALKEFTDFKAENVTADIDEYELACKRLDIRDEKVMEYKNFIKSNYEKSLNSAADIETIMQIDKILGENLPHIRNSVLEKIKRIEEQQKNAEVKKQQQPAQEKRKAVQNERKQKHHKKRDEWER